jgi:hypothetical protein
VFYHDSAEEVDSCLRQLAAVAEGGRGFRPRPDGAPADRMTKVRRRLADARAAGGSLALCRTGVAHPRGESG